MAEKKIIGRDFPLSPTPEPNEPEQDKGDRRFFPFASKKGYKATVVEDTKNGVTTANVKVRRTIGGFLSGKPKGKDIQIPIYNVPQRQQNSESPERPKGSNMGNKDISRRTK